jgi:ribosomal protein L40E
MVPAWTVTPSAAMPLNRHNLILDEQAFQDLLSAAFTVQEHGDWLKQAGHPGIAPQVASDAASLSEALGFCQDCGALKPTSDSDCIHCSTDQFRPGERLQRKLASMWLMSPEHDLGPERTAQLRKASRRESIADNSLRQPAAQRGRDRLSDSTREASLDETLAPEDSVLIDRSSFRASNDPLTLDSSLLYDMPDLVLNDPYAEAINPPTTEPVNDMPPPQAKLRLADIRVTLRFHRANLYLGAAVILAVVALLWPAVRPPRRAALSPMERLLVAVGVAEAPTPVVHFKGDPSVSVWVDPHTALYYCPGEEQYGKTSDGRLSTQHDAQIDRFQPARRSVCE